MNVPGYHLDMQMIGALLKEIFNNRVILKKILQQRNLTFKDKRIEFKASLFYIPRKFYFF